MAVRFYIVPSEEVVDSTTGAVVAHGPKYFWWRFTQNVNALRVPHEDEDYGLEPFFFVAADVTTQQHNALVANSDVFAFAANLDSNLGGQRNTVVAQLEALNLPANHLPGGTAWRQLTRAVLACIQVGQRFHVLGFARVFPAGVTMQTKLSDLPLPHLAAWAQAAADCGYDLSSVSTSTGTVRDLITAIANQGSPRAFLGVSI